jgi:hypothetical protein
MRCLTCGHNMVLIAALPAEQGFVHGFEQQTMQCPACGDAENRFVFKPAVSGARREIRTLPSSTDCMSADVHLSGYDKNEPVPSVNNILVEPMLDTNEIGNLARANNGADHPSVRVNGTHQPLCSANGIEKPLPENRSIKVFASPAKQKSTAGDQAATEAPSRGMQVNGLVFEARECRSANGTNAAQERWLRAVEKFRTYAVDLTQRAERSNKWKANTAQPLTRPSRARLPERCMLARDRFDELWDGLIPDQHRGVDVSVPAASLATLPLPRSLSLVVIETRKARPDRPGHKHASKKVLEKLYESVRRMLPSV